MLQSLLAKRCGLPEIEMDGMDTPMLFYEEC